MASWPFAAANMRAVPLDYSCGPPYHCSVGHVKPVTEWIGCCFNTLHDCGEVVIEELGTFYQVGKAPWLAGGGAQNVFQTLSGCHDKCRALDTCMYGTFIESGPSKGQCWLSQHHDRAKNVACGHSCSAFLKVWQIDSPLLY